jgi:hypothetical protein
MNNINNDNNHDTQMKFDPTTVEEMGFAYAFIEIK